jgi:ribosomal-protein-alanine N-acetyltransferase
MPSTKLYIVRIKNGKFNYVSIDLINIRRLPSMTIPTLATNNLTLRTFSSSDDRVLHQILKGPDTLKYFPTPSAPSLEQVQTMIDRILHHWQTHQYGLWAVELRDTAQLIGRCGLQYIAETDEVEIDFILDRSQWGHGFATEAGQASLHYGFHNLGLEQIIGIVHPDNIASRRVLEKLQLHFVEETEYFGMWCCRYIRTNPSSKA